MRFLVLVVCVASLALVAVGCGGDDESASSADAWADEFCTTVTEWENELDQIGDELGDVSSFTTESLEQAADDADAATDDLIERLRDLGPPDTPSGDAIEQEVEELSDTVEAEREDIREALDDASGLGGLAEAVGQVGTSIAAMTTELEETLRAIDEADADGEVETAIEESEACDEIGP
jgi:ABC-type transporter Mla subunit MlaD